LVEGGGGWEGQGFCGVGSGHSLGVVTSECGYEREPLRHGLLDLQGLRRVCRVWRGQSSRWHSCDCLGAELSATADGLSIDGDQEDRQGGEELNDGIHGEQVGFGSSCE
jgi:hypothetical protein